MKITCSVDVRHLSRVEGHGDVRIRIRNGRVQEASWRVVETPRYFEALLIGKQWDAAPLITSRICGICSVGHTLASIRAIEHAFGIVPTPQTAALRLLLKHMETLQSHVLHMFFLAAPDYLSAGSVFPLLHAHPEIVTRALRLRQLANDACDCIGGRRVHPVRAVVGGFTLLPEKEDLARLRHRLLSSVDDINFAADLFAGFTIPYFVRETEFVSLRGDGSYPFLGGDLMSSDGVRKKEHEYRAMTNEYEAPRSTAKWCRLSRPSFAVGALARCNNNFSFLRAQARDIARRFGLDPVTHNPFMNLIAQLVECAHVVHESADLIGELLDAPQDAPRQHVSPKAGTGVGAVEVPRGLLYHCYEFDRKGNIRACDCVIPTGQNHANIQHDLEALARTCARDGTPEAETELRASMLVRAYDPCISCSVH